MNLSDDRFKGELTRRLESYKMRSHPRLQELVKQGMSREVARRLAFAYQHVNAISPRIMATALSRISDPKLFYVLLLNLWEECGNGIERESHAAMFDKFANAVDDNMWPSPANEAARQCGHELIAGFFRVCRDEADYCVLAMMHGFEAVFADICDSIDAALVKGKTLADASDGRFFQFHALHDIKHANTTREAVIRSADTEQKRRECLRFAELGAGLVYDLFDAVFR